MLGSLEGNVFFISVGVLFLSFCVQWIASLFQTKSTLQATQSEGASKAELSKFQLLVLPPWLLAMFCDWLQGPYLYEAYRTYGISSELISILFAIGFLSSGITGVFAGNLTDKFGRKKSCIAYALLYIVGDFLMNINNFYVLAVGRIFLGAGNAILFTSFDSWMVCEHFSRGLDGNFLGSTYSQFSFGNGLAAIIAGVVASFGVSHFTPIVPFNMALVLLVVLTVYISLTWTENYGQSSAQSESDENVEEGREGEYVSLSDGEEREKKNVSVWRQMYWNPEIWMVGLVQTLFEGSMFGFVVVWTPSLPRAVSQGVAFSTFMVGVMFGSRVFSWLRALGMRVSSCVLTYLLLGAAAFFFHVHTTKTAPSFGDDPADSLASELTPYTIKALAAFVLFEVAVGMHFSAFYNLRATIVPEEGRATIISLFQVPLNALVFVLCLYSGFISHTILFSILTLQLLLAALLLKVIDRRLRLKSGEDINRAFAMGGDALAVLGIGAFTAIMFYQ